MKLHKTSKDDFFKTKVYQVDEKKEETPLWERINSLGEIVVSGINFPCNPFGDWFYKVVLDLSSPHPEPRILCEAPSYELLTSSFTDLDNDIINMNSPDKALWILIYCKVEWMQTKTPTHQYIGQHVRCLKVVSAFKDQEELRSMLESKKIQYKLNSASFKMDGNKLNG